MRYLKSSQKSLTYTKSKIYENYFKIQILVKLNYFNIYHIINKISTFLLFSFYFGIIPKIAICQYVSSGRF